MKKSTGRVAFCDATDCDYAAQGEYEIRAKHIIVTIRVLIKAKWHTLVVQVPKQ